MDEQSLAFWIVTGTAAFLIGLAKGGMGGMLGAFATPLMALVLPADEVIGLVLPMLMVADIFAIAFYWKKWDWTLTWRMLPGAVGGVLVATLFLTNAPTRTIQISLGVIVLLFTIYKVFEKQILKIFQYQPRNWHGYLAGILAGFASALAHNGGPPVTIYLLLQDGMTPLLFNGTSAIFFTILNWVKVPFYLAAGIFDPSQMLKILGLVLLIPLGTWIGIWAAGRIDPLQFERLILALLALTALLLIFP
jgi:uncharacterized membrane protein YfcA